MFISFRMTVKKLLVITAAAVMLVLIIDAVRTMQSEEKVICRNDTERAAYLRSQGIIADPEPVWEKQTVIDPDGGDGWSEYAGRLGRTGAELADRYGCSVTVRCYAVSGGADPGFVRVISSGSEVICYDLAKAVKAT